MKKIKIVIEFPNEVKREYCLHDKLVEKIMQGKFFILKSQHPKFSETFIVRIETSDIESYLREFADKCIEYSAGKINGTELGMAQVLCAVQIKKIFNQ